jgi:hypothetical protein
MEREQIKRRPCMGFGDREPVYYEPIREVIRERIVCKPIRIAGRHITIEWILERRPCGPEGPRWFKKKFPTGGTVGDILAACRKPEWINWFLRQIEVEHRLENTK